MKGLFKDIFLNYKLTYDKTLDKNKNIFLPKKLSFDKTDIKKEVDLMDKKEKMEKPGAGEKINQFIIECMFNKYFEEEEINKSIVVEKEKVLV